MEIPTNLKHKPVIVVEDYDKVTLPIERIALYFCLLGAVILVLSMWFIHKITVQQIHNVYLPLSHRAAVCRAAYCRQPLIYRRSGREVMAQQT